MSEYFATALVSSVKTWVSSPSSKILWWILHHTSVNKFYEISTIVNTLLSISHHGINNDVGDEKEQWTFYKTKLSAKHWRKELNNFFHSESEDMLIFGFCLRVSSGAGVVVSVVERLILGWKVQVSAQHYETLAATCFKQHSWRQLKLPCTGTCLQIIVKKQNFLH